MDAASNSTRAFYVSALFCLSMEPGPWSILACGTAWIESCDLTLAIDLGQLCSRILDTAIHSEWDMAFSGTDVAALAFIYIYIYKQLKWHCLTIT